MSSQETLSSAEYQARYGANKLFVPTKVKSLKGRPSLKEPPVMDGISVYGDGSVIITLVGLFPSLNKMLRMHWAIRKKQKALLMERLSVLNIPKFSTKVSIRLTFYHSLLGDEDGLSGRGKSLLDCLVDKGVLLDDSPQYVTIEKPVQIKSRRKEQKLQITITAI